MRPGVVGQLRKAAYFKERFSRKLHKMLVLRLFTATANGVLPTQSHQDNELYLWLRVKGNLTADTSQEAGKFRL